MFSKDWNAQRAYQIRDASSGVDLVITKFLCGRGIPCYSFAGLISIHVHVGIGYTSRTLAPNLFGCWVEVE